MSDEIEENDDDGMSIMVSTLESLTGLSTKKRIKRTAMGDYIPGPGGKPLTSLGDCLPAPSDYMPKTDLTHHAAPHYSIAGPYKSPRSQYQASSLDNNTSADMEWKDRTFAIKGKGKMKPYDVTDNAHITDSIGPARYFVQHETMGKLGPKWTLAERSKYDVRGPPNCLVQPADTHGYTTPGPDYRPNSGYWGRGPIKSFGNSRKQASSNQEGPGPAEYKLGELPEGLTHTLAKRLPPPIPWQQATSNDNPAPNQYALATTIGRAVAKSMTGRQATIIQDLAPAANCYIIPSKLGEAPAAPLTYRTFEHRLDARPGPEQYGPSLVNKQSDPSYSIRRRTRPCFPDILRYPLLSQNVANPGPGEYEDIGGTAKNDKPAFSMGKRERKPKNDLPGPSHYKIAVDCQPHKQKLPAFSMARRFKTTTTTSGPGPAAYNPKTKSKGSSGYSMTCRPRSHRGFLTPAPNAYTLKLGEKSTGRFTGPCVTLKSRFSPYVYSGFATNRLLDAKT